MNGKLDKKRIGLFLGLSFLIASGTAIIIYWTGGLVKSPEVIPGARITVAVLLLATGYMWAPALAHILTRVITREGWQDMFLEPRFRRGWPYWLEAWFVPRHLDNCWSRFVFYDFPRLF